MTGTTCVMVHRRLATLALRRVFVKSSRCASSQNLSVGWRADIFPPAAAASRRRAFRAARASRSVAQVRVTRRRPPVRV